MGKMRPGSVQNVRRVSSSPLSSSTSQVGKMRLFGNSLAESGGAKKRTKKIAEKGAKKGAEKGVNKGANKGAGNKGGRK